MWLEVRGRLVAGSGGRPGLWDIPGQFPAPLQLHRGLDRLDALTSRSNGLTQRKIGRAHV